MSSDPPVDLDSAEGSETPAVRCDDASNHIMEIPIQSSAKDEPSNSENNSNSDSDDDDFPFDLTFEWLD